MLGISYFCVDFSFLARKYVFHIRFHISDVVWDIVPDLCTDVRKTFFENSSRSLGMLRSFSM